MFECAKRMDALPFSGIRVMMEKATQMQKQGADVIHMEIGRPDFDTPEVIKQAAYDSIKKGNVFYTSNYGTPELRQAIADKLSRENGVDYTLEEILVTIGVGEGTYAAIAAFLNPGDEVLVPDPIWLNYIHVPNFFGAVPVSYSLLEENDYQLNIDEIESLVTERTRMLVINTPGNPTGVIQNRQTLEQLADLAKKHNLIVVADEIYEKLVYDNAKHVSIASIPGMKERTITLNGFSKCYSMTGWRLGYAAAPVSFIKAMVRVHQYVNTCAASFVQEAGITALENAEPDVQIMVKEYERRRNYAVEAINAIDGLSCKKPDGAFYIFVNIKKLGLSASEMANYLLEEAKIATVPGSAFGPQGEGYIRISYACSYERIVEGIERLKQAIYKLKSAK
ncbi:MAG: pyridoxal phosphate-dependent aminotransferase [Oscillospiraceae bacterium]|nr:pyridoxal phosphate-dependent aminotransferase [Oscillospiraceae bacterium]